MKLATFLLLCFAPVIAPAQETDIRTMLQDSVDAWNRGDLVAFVSYYEDTPGTTFVGEETVRGNRSAILDRYQRKYPNKPAMGTVKFTDIRVRPLEPHLAIVTGRFHLTRTEAAGGNASGKYSLVVRKTTSGWKIIHDHTS